MKEITGDIFDYLTDKETDAICIFTNGITNKHGSAIVGAGQAGIAASKWWNFRYNLGHHLTHNGNVVGVIGKASLFKDTNGQLKDATMLGLPKSEYAGAHIISFPTKEHFNKPAIPELIVRSAYDLVKISNDMNFKKIIMGRPGCGTNTGKLIYDKDVKPLIENILDDRFIIINKE